jgi:hypothetical protein
MITLGYKVSEKYDDHFDRPFFRSSQKIADHLSKFAEKILRSFAS